MKHAVKPPVATDLPEPLLKSRRRRMLATSSVVMVLLIALTAKLATMLVAQALGSRAWEAGDAVGADRYFAVNQRFNLFERWIAPYDLGVAAQSRKEWQDASALYQQALKLAPDSARCRIVLNWTWALEAGGDEAKAAGDLDTAARFWRQAQTTLQQAGECDDGSSNNSGQSAAQGTSTPSASSSPSAAPTPTGSATPLASPTSSSGPSSQPGQSDTGDPSSSNPDDDQSGQADGEGQQPNSSQGQATGSQEQQRQETRKRVEQKLGQQATSDSRGDDAPQGEEQRMQRLDRRNQEAVKQRQRLTDDQRQSTDNSPAKSW